MKANYRVSILTSLFFIVGFLIFLPTLSTHAYAYEDTTDTRANWNEGAAIYVNSYSEHFIDSGSEIEVDIDLAGPPPSGTTSCASIENPNDAYTSTANSCSISGDTVTATFLNPPTDVSYPADFWILFSNSGSNLGYTLTTFTVDPSSITTPPTTITFPDNLANWTQGTIVYVNSYSEHFIDSGSEIEVDIDLAGPPPSGTTSCASIENPNDAYTSTANSCSISGDTVTATFLNPPTDVTYPANFWILFSNSGSNLGFTNTTFTVDPSTIGYNLTGTVFTDTNHNGVQDNGEQGYNDATVTLSQNNETVATTTTDSNGNYTFSNVEGNYSVAVTVPSGDIATTSNPATINVTANTTQNFGIAPAVTTLTPSQDSFIDGISANSNNGAGTYLQLTRSGHERALVQFNESQIQSAIGNDSNYTATLVFTITSTDANWGSVGRQIDIDRLNQPWTEGNGSFVQNLNKGTGSGVTWNCATDANISGVLPNCSGSTAWDMTDTSSWPFVSTPTATATITNNETGTVSFNVTSDVQSYLNGTANDGWIVRKDDESKNGVVQFSSREGSNAPQLIITDH